MTWNTKLGSAAFAASLLLAGSSGLVAFGQTGKGGVTGKGAMTGKGAAKAMRFPHIRAAIRELREAKRELEQGAHIFGGHRVLALRASEQAIEQLEIALRVAR
jgi:hypothetical protein